MSRRLGTIPSSVVLRSRGPGARRRDKAHRREAFSRLRQVGRVYAPEADMRPVLPHRDLLLKSVAPLASRSSEKNTADPFMTKRAASSAFIGRLTARASECVDAGQMTSFAKVVDEAVAAPPGVDPAICVRAVTVGAVQRVAATDSSRMEAVMNCFAEAGVLQQLPNEDVGMVLDLLVRGMLSRGDLSSAFRGELLSRLLDTRLRRGTYAALIEKSRGLELGLAMFHRAIAAGVEPNRKMLHAVLDICFSAHDGARARAVLAEMAARGISVNGDTIRILLRRTPCVDSVSAVLHLVQARDSRVRVSPHLALLFVEAYLKTPAETVEEGDRKVAKVFETLDWFFDRGVGVPHAAVDAILEHCVQVGRVEGALRAWREMRRGWLGPPGRKSRTMLWVMLADRPELRRRLIGDDVPADEMTKLRRAALAHTDDAEMDRDVLGGEDVKDQAAVLHRWARTGRAQEVMDWVEMRIRRTRGRGADARVVLSVLSDVNAGTRNKSLDFCLAHLASGESVRGDRATVVRRAVDGIWKWILRGEGDESVESLLFDESVDRGELQACLERVVRVVPEAGFDE